MARRRRPERPELLARVRNNALRHALVLHGDDDQVVPFPTTGKIAATLLPLGTLKVIAGAPHDMCTTHKNVINEELIAFLEA